MYTIDTSVWVSATELTDVGYADSRAFIAELRRRAPLIIVPPPRARRDRRRGQPAAPARAARVLAIFDRLPRITLVALDAPLGDVAAQLAREHRLRGVDAVYAAVTRQHATTLISRDREHLTRLAGIVPVQSPVDALAALPPP